MAETTKKATKSPTVPEKPENLVRGLLFASLSIPVAMFFWVLLWNGGFIASIVSLGMVWLMVRLYVIGANHEPTKQAAIPLLVLVVAGVALSFLAGMASDAAAYYNEETHLSGITTYTSGDFWSFYFANLGSSELWSGYMKDLLISVAFAALGCYSFVGALLMLRFAPAPAEAPKKSAAKK